MKPCRTLCLALFLGLAAGNATAQVISLVDVDVNIQNPVVAFGDEMVVDVPVGAGLATTLFYAPTSSLNLGIATYATDLIGSPELGKFQQYQTVLIADDLTVSYPAPFVTSNEDMTVFFVTVLGSTVFASNLEDVTITPDGSCSGTPGHLQEEGGLIVSEIEWTTRVDDWEEESSKAGFTGASYYRWDGPDLFNSPGSGIISFPVEIYTSGTYRLKIHNRHDDPASDMENDCWVRVNGGTWEKYFSNGGIVAQWNWAGGLDDGNGGSKNAEYTLNPGTHLIEISGRSKNYHIDRLHFFIPGAVSDPLNLNKPQSCSP